MANPRGVGGFAKGKSGNPGGRPNEVGHVRELAREHTAVAVGTLVIIMKNTKSPPSARVAAANAVLDRGYGRPGAMSVHFKLPELGSAADASRAMAAITAAVACGELTPAEAGELSRLVDAYVRAVEATEIERRLQALEEQQPRDLRLAASYATQPSDMLDRSKVDR
jgi:hypothetical protein